jgi:hypothetical protein
MDIAETIYQHVKIMSATKALEVLRFIAFIETKNNLFETVIPDSNMLEFIQKSPITKNRTDIEINQAFQSLRDEWE